MSMRKRGGRGGYEPPARIMSRQARAWELAARGRTQREIAQDLGVTQPAVSKMVKRAATAVSQELVDDTRAYVARLVAQLDHVYHEMMQAWERSKTDQTRRRHRRVDHESGSGAQGATTTVEASVITREGDPRFVGHALRALAQKCLVLEMVCGPALREADEPVEASLAALSNEALITLLRFSRARMPLPDWDAPGFASIPSDGLLTAEVGRRLAAGTLTDDELLPLRKDQEAREDAEDCDETTRRYYLEQRARRKALERDSST
jgi:predicted transcriptional regulator